MSNDGLIEGRGVTKVFRDFWGRPKVTAVDAVDISVPRGTVFGLLGPNGAGKSTLIKMILGHLYPSAGALEVFGVSPRAVEPKERLGYLPEQAAFYRNLTSEEILFLYGRLLGLPEGEISRRADQLLDMVGLSHARDRRVREFSHGMGRRLGLAQALLNDPDLVLLDEPTAGLDPIGCYEVKALIGTLAHRGKTVLMSSHLLADVQDVCNTIMIMYGGKVLQVGAVKDLLAKSDEVEIRAPAATEDALNAVRSILGADKGADSVSVSQPTRSLEDYFLAVVRDANRGDAKTDGARVGTGVADYLRGGMSEEDILSELTGGAAASSAEPSVERPPDADRIELDRLSRPSAAGPEADAAGESSGSKVDKDLLDRLTK